MSKYLFRVLKKLMNYYEAVTGPTKPSSGCYALVTRPMPPDAERAEQQDRKDDIGFGIDEFGRDDGHADPAKRAENRSALAGHGPEQAVDQQRSRKEEAKMEDAQ